MGISKKKKELLCKWHDMRCEDCKANGNKKIYKLGELEVHRIHTLLKKSDYQDHRKLKILCKKHHDIYSSADRIAEGIQK